MAKQNDKQSTDLALYDEELARLAGEAATQEANTGGGKFIGTRNGVMKVNGSEIPNNELAAVVADFIFLNAFYEGDFDPDHKAPPVCFAMGRDEAGLKPHPQSSKPQATDCATCEQNVFGSASKGKGKACKNQRRVALLPAGTIDGGKLKEGGKFKAFTEQKHFATTERYYLNVPPTSTPSFGAYVKQLSAALKVPPFAVFTHVYVKPDPKKQFVITFEPLTRAPAAIIPTLLERHKAERAVIEFPFPKAEDDAPAAAKTGKKSKKY